MNKFQTMNLFIVGNNIAASSATPVVLDSFKKSHKIDLVIVTENEFISHYIPKILITLRSHLITIVTDISCDRAVNALIKVRK